MQVHKSITMKKELSKDIKGIDFFNTLKGSKSVLVFLLVIFLISLFPLKFLVAKDFKTGQYLNLWKVKDKEEFTIEYTHSVEKSPVTEKYKIYGDSLILLETSFKSYGAGLPATTEYKFELTEDGFRIYDINKEYKEVIYRTGAEIANHELTIGDKVYNFLDFSERRTGVEFSMEKIKVINYIIKKIVL